ALVDLRNPLRGGKARGRHILQAVKPFAIVLAATQKVVNLHSRQMIAVAAPGSGVVPTMRAGAANGAVLRYVVKLGAVQGELEGREAGEKLLVNLRRYDGIGHATTDAGAFIGPLRARDRVDKKRIGGGLRPVVEFHPEVIAVL